MPITTELLGRLGGTPETREVPLKLSGSSSDESIPTGWKKAIGVFTGKNMNQSVRIFGSYLSVPSAYSAVNGGGVLTAGETASFSSVEGTLTWYRLE